MRRLLGKLLFASAGQEMLAVYAHKIVCTYLPHNSFIWKNALVSHGNMFVRKNRLRHERRLGADKKYVHA
jgi:hypothetical protein